MTRKTSKKLFLVRFMGLLALYNIITVIRKGEFDMFFILLFLFYAALSFFGM